jgi:hypothetical protein
MNISSKIKKVIIYVGIPSLTFGLGLISGAKIYEKAIKETYLNPKKIALKLNESQKPIVVEAKKKDEKIGVLALYQVSYTDKKAGRKTEANVFKFGNLIFTNVYRLMPDGTVTKVKTERTIFIPVDISFLESIENKFKKEGINITAGTKGKPKLYIIFDALCPFCAESFEKKYPELAGKYEIVFIPLAVHGIYSVNALTSIYTEAKDKPIAEVIGKNFKLFREAKGNMQEFVKETANLPKDEHVKKLIISTSEELLKNKVFETPTLFMPTPKGYLKLTGSDLAMEKQVKKILKESKKANSGS